MKRFAICLTLTLATVAIGFSISAANQQEKTTISGPQFGVVIRVFEGSSETPATETQVLFDDTSIYALPSDPAEQITVIDFSEGKVVLIEPTKHLATTMPIDDLVRLTEMLRQKASSESQREQLGIDAKVQKDASTHRYSVQYGQLKYQTTTQLPSDPKMAHLFGKFSDVVAQLNIARRRGLPPLGRMRMNAQIAADARVPMETQLELNSGDDVAKYHSTHSITNEISDEQRQRIHQVASMKTLYKSVPLAEFPQ